MLIKWKGRERTRLLLVLPSNSYYPQRKHWPAPEQQAHTSHVLGSAEPCPRCPPVLQTSLEHHKVPQDELGAPSCFQHHLPLWQITLHDVSVGILALQCASPAAGVQDKLCSSSSAALTPARWDRAQSCQETSGGKGKPNTRCIGVRFTSLNYSPPSSALPPLGNTSPSLHAGIWKKQMNSKCFQSRHKTSWATTLPCLQEQWTPQEVPSDCRDISLGGARTKNKAGSVQEV